jgi:hypothetical protein
VCVCVCDLTPSLRPLPWATQTLEYSGNSRGLPTSTSCTGRKETLRPVMSSCPASDERDLSSRGHWKPSARMGRNVWQGRGDSSACPGMRYGCICMSGGTRAMYRSPAIVSTKHVIGADCPIVCMKVHQVNCKVPIPKSA